VPRYNGSMPTEADPYKVLGTPRDATLDEVKLAYRRAVLKYHPDNYAGDPREAAQKFRHITEAYHAILATCVVRESAATETRTFTPQDFARAGFGRPSAAVAGPYGSAPGAEDRPELSFRGRHKYATRNEPAIFVAFWAVAMVLGAVAGLATAYVRIGSGPGGEAGTADVLLSIVLAEIVYAAVAAATVVALVLTRKIVGYTLSLASQRWRVLPGAKRNRKLPRDGSGRELPRRRRR
jgi:hypothetical protein